MASEMQNPSKSEVADLSILGSVEVSIEAVLGHKKILIKDLNNLQQGQSLALDTPLNGSVEIKLNGVLIAIGEIIAVDDQFGVRITKLADKD